MHLDRRLGPPACSTGGYPPLRRGSVGVYVCVLQDALNIACRAGLTIDGIFGVATTDMVEFFQATNRLPADGIVGCGTWRALMAQSVGKGS